MDVPGVGWLAKSQSKDDLKDEFMIFITPTVLADWKAGERQKTYEELEQVSLLLASRAGLSTAEESMADVAAKIAELVAT